MIHIIGMASLVAWAPFQSLTMIWQREAGEDFKRSKLNPPPKKNKSNVQQLKGKSLPREGQNHRARRGFHCWNCRASWYKLPLGSIGLSFQGFIPPFYSENATLHRTKHMADLQPARWSGQSHLKFPNTMRWHHSKFSNQHLQQQQSFVYKINLFFCSNRKNLHIPSVSVPTDHQSNQFSPTFNPATWSKGRPSRLDKQVSMSWSEPELKFFNLRSWNPSHQLRVWGPVVWDSRDAPKLIPSL